MTYAEYFEATVTVEIEEFLDAIDLDEESRVAFDHLLPATLKAKDRVAVNATVKMEDAREALEIDLNDLREGLEAALRGDRRMAMYLLSRCFETLGAGAHATRTIEDLCLASRPVGHPELPIFAKGH